MKVLIGLGALVSVVASFLLLTALGVGFTIFGAHARPNSAESWLQKILDAT